MGSWSVKVQATCSKEGTKERKCTNSGCTYSETQTIAKKAHTYGDWATTVYPTCFRPGVQRHVCTNCGAEETASIPALTHEYEWVTTKNATCTEAGTKKYTCKYCGSVKETQTIGKLGHSMGSWSTTAATCTKDGQKTRKCTRSGCSYKETETLTKTGHSGAWTYASTTNHKRTCTVCGTTETAGHQLSGDGVIIQYGDCNKPTIRRYTCSVCGTFTKEDPYGHQYGSWTSAGTANHKRTCSVCGKTETAGHQLSGDGVIIQYGDCNKPTIRRYTCSVCGTFTKEDPYGHQYGSWSSAGTKNHKRTCTVCGKTETAGHQLSGDPVIIQYGDCNKPTIWRYTCSVCGTFTMEDPYGHQFGSWTYSGIEKHKRTCSVCGKTETAGHQFSGDGVIIQYGDCNKPTIRQYTCSVCGTFTKEDPYGHDYNDWSYAGTENHKRTCSVCGKTETNGHQITGYGLIVQYGDCNKPTIRQYTCSVCGTFTKEDPYGHDYGDWSYAGTENHKRTCSVCGKTETESHQISGDGVILVYGDCNKPTIRQYTCSVCGTFTKEDPYGHDYGDWSYAGTENHKRTCSVCGATETEGHQITGDGVILVYGDCNKPTIRRYTCAVCSTFTKEDPYGHEYGDWSYADSDNHVHTCSVCGATETEGHQVTGDGVILVYGDCNKPTIRQYSCSVCGTFTKEDSYGHEYGEWSYAGTESHKLTCSVCGATETEGHQVSGNGMILEYGNCNRPTIRLYNCSVCGIFTKEDPYGHEYGEWSYANSDNHTRTCSVCGATETEGHQVTGDGVILVYGDCNKPTIRRYTCSVCGTFTKEEDYGHEYGDWTSAGSESHVCTCSICGATETEGHKIPDDGVSVRYACDPQGGLKQGTCEICGALIEEEYNDHKWEDEPFETRAACHEDGGYEKYRCQLCPETKTVDLEHEEHDLPDEWEYLGVDSYYHRKHFVRECRKCDYREHRQEDPDSVLPEILDALGNVWEEVKNNVGETIDDIISSVEEEYERIKIAIPLAGDIAGNAINSYIDTSSAAMVTLLAGISEHPEQILALLEEYDNTMAAAENQLNNSLDLAGNVIGGSKPETPLEELQNLLQELVNGAPAGSGSSSILGTTPINTLPQNVQDAYNNYSKNNWAGKYSGQTPKTKAGGKYQNRNGALPTQTNSGDQITYREYDVNNCPDNAKRDSHRFVVGSDGSVYYTFDHYKTFIKIDK